MVTTDTPCPYSCFRGLGTALVTPFLPDGAVDYMALQRLVEQQLRAQVDFLVVLGTTAEAATMSASERLQVQRFIAQVVDGRLPLMIGVGGNNTAAVCDALRETDLSAFSAVLSVCPYYNKPNQEGLFRHFCAVAEASPLPVVLYNVPGRTGVNLLPETVMRILAACGEKVLGIKEASGNVEQIKRLIMLRDRAHSPLLVISGDDGIASTLMHAGADGLISVASNAYPEVFGTIVRKADDALQGQYADMIQLLFREGNPTGIKALLSVKEHIHNVLRLPLVPASDVLMTDIRREAAALS